MTRTELNAQYDALAIPIMKDVLVNHYEHYSGFPECLFRMTQPWIEKLECLGYEMSGIKSLVCQLTNIKEG